MDRSAQLGACHRLKRTARELALPGRFEIEILPGYLGAGPWVTWTKALGRIQVAKAFRISLGVIFR